MLKAVELTKRYEDGTLAVSEFNLAVKPGELYCLLGANGAGKTTTISLFLDFIGPTAGHTYINGINVQERPIEAKRFASYISENVMLYTGFTARQNLNFFAKLSKKKGLSKDQADAMLARVGLEPRAFDTRVKSFSKGMRQKLGIAIALSKDALAIILDEPTSGLDPKSAAEFMELLDGLRNEGRAILMSTHDIFRAKDFADTVGIMKSGVLVGQLDRAMLLTADLEAIYLDYMKSGVTSRMTS